MEASETAAHMAETSDMGDTHAVGETATSKMGDIYAAVSETVTSKMGGTYGRLERRPRQWNRRGDQRHHPGAKLAGGQGAALDQRWQFCRARHPRRRRRCRSSHRLFDHV